MKVSELIVRLEAALVQYGDLRLSIEVAGQYADIVDIHRDYDYTPDFSPWLVLREY